MSEYEKQVFRSITSQSNWKDGGAFSWDWNNGWMKQGLLGTDSKGMDNLYLDITDNFLGYKGLDRRGILGNNSIINDSTFSSIMNYHVEGSIINYMQNYLTGQNDYRTYQMLPDGKMYAVGIDYSKVNKDTMNYVKQLFGVNGNSSEFDKRLNEFIDLKNNFINDKIGMINAWKNNFTSQNKLSDALGWGYLPDGSSSLCVATSLMESHDANVLNHTDFDTKKEFMKYAQNVIIGKYDDGTDMHLIESDGRVMDALRFTQEYAKYTNTAAPIGLNGNARFGLMSHTFNAEYGYSHKITYDFNSRSMFYNSWTNKDGFGNSFVYDEFYTRMRYLDVIYRF
jgi:hypothetical protein